MLTEKISPRYVDLNSWSTGEMIGALYESQLGAAAAVRSALDAMAAAVDEAVAVAAAGRAARLCRGRHLRPHRRCRTEPSCRRPSIGRPTA